jgi:hypothetical protein
LITAAYLKVRYGELPESSEEVENVEHAWTRISQAGDEMVKAAKKKS